jgi:hypothetical protein
MRNQVFNLNLFIEGKKLMENANELALMRRVRKRDRKLVNSPLLEDKDTRNFIYVKRLGDFVFIWTKFFYKDKAKEGIEELCNLVKLTLRFMVNGEIERLKSLYFFAYDRFLIISNVELKFKQIKEGILVDF